MKFLNIKDSKNNRVAININQIKKMSESRGETLIYFGNELYTRTKLTIDELLSKIAI